MLTQTDQNDFGKPCTLQKKNGDCMKSKTMRIIGIQPNKTVISLIPSVCFGLFGTLLLDRHNIQYSTNKNSSGLGRCCLDGDCLISSRHNITQELERYRLSVLLRFSFRFTAFGSLFRGLNLYPV